MSLGADRMVAPNVGRAEAAIRELLAKEGSSPLAPADLLTRLWPEHDDSVIREALWRLIDSREVELTPDRRLLLRQYVVRFQEAADEP